MSQLGNISNTESEFLSVPSKTILYTTDGLKNSDMGFFNEEKTGKRFTRSIFTA